MLCSTITRRSRAARRRTIYKKAPFRTVQKDFVILVRQKKKKQAFGILLQNTTQHYAAASTKPSILRFFFFEFKFEIFLFHHDALNCSTLLLLTLPSFSRRFDPSLSHSPWFVMQEGKKQRITQSSSSSFNSFSSTAFHELFATVF